MGVMAGCAELFSRLGVKRQHRKGFLERELLIFFDIGCGYDEMVRSSDSSECPSNPFSSWMHRLRVTSVTHLLRIVFESNFDVIDTLGLLYIRHYLMTDIALIPENLSFIIDLLVGVQERSQDDGPGIVFLLNAVLRIFGGN